MNTQLHIRAQNLFFFSHKENLMTRPEQNSSQSATSDHANLCAYLGVLGAARNLLPFNHKNHKPNYHIRYSNDAKHADYPLPGQTHKPLVAQSIEFRCMGSKRSNWQEAFLKQSTVIKLCKTSEHTIYDHESSFNGQTVSALREATIQNLSWLYTSKCRA